MATLRMALAQFDFSVGATQANAARVVELAARARADGTDLLVCPELALCGYPADDLLLRADFLAACDQALQTVMPASADIDILLGHPAPAPTPAPVAGASVHAPNLLNAASLLRAGQVLSRYAKQALPDYGVFDEHRYFIPGSGACVVPIQGVRVGLLICEDIWLQAPTAAACAAGAELLIVINASPFDADKPEQRLAVLQRQAQEHGIGIAYVNLIGGQDELVFDGGSLLIDADGALAASGPMFREVLLPAHYDSAKRRFHAPHWPPVERTPEAVLYAGLVRGIRDYVYKNGFKGVLLGLSGGIDSALSLALAVDALGAEQVSAVMMPSPFTSPLSLHSARDQAHWAGVAYQVLPIEAGFDALQATLATAFAGKAADLTEENMQSRLRGLMLMALSNKHGQLLLATGNKSEMAVGYATLYGDMCGAYAPLKDVYKSNVYRLARWRNRQSQAIPPAVIERPPSAELRPNQVDQDSLPAYDELDAILRQFIECDRSLEQIVAAGHERQTVQQVLRLVLANEFKRRQSPPGPKLTSRALGRERRYPITSGWRP